MTYARARIVGDRIARAKSSVLLLGPRQVGKSTLCRELDPALYVDLADESEYLGFAKDPARLRREVEALPLPALVVIDEIQRVPALMNTVQSLIDGSGRRLRIVLTGSSARRLLRGGANLLPGRIVLERLDPLLASEIGRGFDLERALRLGTLPGIYHGDDEAPELLGTYAEVYLREEIQAEAAVRDIGGYARFLDTIALSSGQWLNYSKLASDAEIPKETIRRYVQLLEDSLIAFRIPPFSPRAGTTRRVLQRERVLLFDVGVRNAILGIHRGPLRPNEVGPLFEQWVILQVLYLSHALRLGWHFSSYRSEAGAEVDLVIDTGREILAIEVKAGRNVSAADTRGLVSLSELIPGRKPYRPWIVFRGSRRQRFENGVEAVPVLEALAELASLGA